MMKAFIGFNEARDTTLASMPETSTEYLSLIHLTGRIIASDIRSKVNSPSVDASLKDGYAVRSSEIANASDSHPAILHLDGHISAGVTSQRVVEPGRTFRITTGSPLPKGADAVLSEEFTSQEGDRIICRNTAGKGRNVLKKGTDIMKGHTVARKNDRVTPALLGLLATAGLDGALVYKQPKVCVIATGDEVVAPGLPLPEGKLYASNVTEICSWLDQFGIDFTIAYVKDKQKEIRNVLLQHLPHVDAFITSGGIWGSEKDMMIQVLDSLGWEGLYHRVRMGPGKAIAFGLLENKPFFCLPGGPPSNEMAFLQIALPGILRMAGETHLPYLNIAATLTEGVDGHDTWTQFIHAQIKYDNNRLIVQPLKQGSRLQSMANKNALIMLPEGCSRLDEGATITVQVLDSRSLCS